MFFGLLPVLPEGPGFGFRWGSGLLVVPYETGVPCTGQSLSGPPRFSFGEPWRTGGKRVTDGPPLSIEWEVDAKRGGLGKKRLQTEKP